MIGYSVMFIIVLAFCIRFNVHGSLEDKHFKL